MMIPTQKLPASQVTLKLLEKLEHIAAGDKMDFFAAVERTLGQ